MYFMLVGFCYLVSVKYCEDVLIFYEGIDILRKYEFGLEMGYCYIIFVLVMGI